MAQLNSASRCLLLPFCLLTCGLLPAAAQDMPLTQVLIPGQGWELVSSGHKFTEGPAVAADGTVVFADVQANTIHRVGLDGKVTLFADNTLGMSGLMFGPDGRLYTCSMNSKEIVAIDANGAREVIAGRIPGNDLVVNSRGEIYVTDPPGRQVWLIDAQRKASVVAGDIQPNGVILWADEGTLVVTEREAPHLWTYRVANDGSLEHRERYYGPLMLASGQQRPGSDGMTVDSDGRLYVATHAGVQMFDPTGRLGGVIAKPAAARSISNVVLGGPQFDTLYVTAGDKVFRRLTKVTGAPYFQRGAK